MNISLIFKPLTQELEMPKEESQELSKVSEVCCSANQDEDENTKMRSVLEGFGEEAPEGYEETDGSEYDSIQLSANQSSEQDTKLWKTRYRFTKGTSKTPEGETRAFCRQMLSLATSGRVYRKEDIELMSSQGVNGKFSKKGESTYDIFKYAGGSQCHHRWERVVYKKKLDSKGNPKKGGAMASTVEKNVNQATREGYKAPKNHRDVAIAEIDKPNGGRLN